MSDRRTALLNAAIEQIASKGTRGMRIEKVARAAGVSPALIYHHFGNRSRLLQQALQYVGERAETYTKPVAGSARAMLLGLLASEFQDNRTVRTNSAAWGELRDSAIFDAALRPTLTALTQKWVRSIAELVRSGHRDGSISSVVNPEAAGICFTALAEGLSSRWLAGLLSTRAAREHLATGVNAMLNGADDSG
jgi:AcrR family transcriptional regulator